MQWETMQRRSAWGRACVRERESACVCMGVCVRVCVCGSVILASRAYSHLVSMTKK